MNTQTETKNDTLLKEAAASLLDSKISKKRRPPMTEEEERETMRMREEFFGKVSTHSMSIDQYLKNIDRDKTILHPSFQRDFCWSRKQASFLIESMLLGFHIGEVVVTEERKEMDLNPKSEICDAQQRSIAIWCFKHNEFPLCDLEKLVHLNGRYYNDLPEWLQDCFDNYNITVHTYQNMSNNMKYDLFERTNSGKPLTSMEKLWASGDRDLIECIKDISSDKTVRSFFARSNAYFNNRGRCRDEIIKNYIIETRSVGKASKSARVIHFKNYCDESVESIKKSILTAFGMMKELFGAAPDSRPGGGPVVFFTGYRHPTQGGCNLVIRFGFELLKWCESHQNKYACIIRARDRLEAACLQAVHRFDDESKGRTSKKQTRELARRLIHELLDPIADEVVEKRLFDSRVKNDLWSQSEDHVCGICGQRILDAESAEVDHVVPFSRGGRTTIENAQLVHSVCNKSKGGKQLSVAP